MSIETSFFSSKAPKERKVCIAKWHRNWSGPRAERFAPSDPNAVDWKAAYRKELESRFPTPSSLRLYLQEIEKRTPDPILCCFELNPEECHRRACRQVNPVQRLLQQLLPLRPVLQLLPQPDVLPLLLLQFSQLPVSGFQLSVLLTGLHIL